MYSWVCPQTVLYDVLKLNLSEYTLQNPLQLAPTVTVTRPDKRGNERGYASFGIFKKLWQTCALENKVQLWPIFVLYYQKITAPIKFCH